MSEQSILQQQLTELIKSANQIHEEAEQLYQGQALPTVLKNEFKNKTEQYLTMYESVETMKSLATKQEAIENLMTQQISILERCKEVDTDWIKRANEYLNR